MSVVRALGHAIGRFAYLVDWPHRRIALENLATSFPGRPASERRALARSMFAHFGALLFELLKFGTLSRAQMLAAIEGEGEDRARQALAQGQGGPVLHRALRILGNSRPRVRAANRADVAPCPSTRQSPSSTRCSKISARRTGNRVIQRRGAVRRILKDLAAGRSVAILIDQHLHESDAVYVGFFQRPAATTSALAALALRTGAPVMPVFALPLPHGRYRLIYERPVDPPLTDSPDAVREFTQRCTDVLEMYVRRHPELWLWMHRRWRDDPGSGIRDSGSGIEDLDSDSPDPVEPGIPDTGSRSRRERSDG